MLVTNPFEISNWQGGLNDTLSGEPNQYNKAENLFLSVDNTWLSRPGSVCYDTTHAQLPSGNQRVGTLINFNKDDTLLAHSGQNLYYYNGAGWTEILGPTGSPAFIGATTAGHLHYAEWKKHLFFCSDENLTPVKVFKNSLGTWVAQTAGLPAPAVTQNYVTATVLANAITLCNSLKSNLTGHFATVFAGKHRVADTVASGIITAANATDLPSLITLTNQLIKAYSSHYYDQTGAGIYHYPFLGSVIDLYATPDQMVLLSTAPCTDLPSAAALLNDLKVKYNTHDGSMSIHNYGQIFHLENNSTLFDVTAGPVALLDWNFFFTLANTLQTNYNAHIGSGGTATTPHSTAADPADVSSVATAVSPETLRNLIWDLRKQYIGFVGSNPGHEIDARLTAGWSYHAGKETSSHGLTCNGGEVTLQIGTSSDLFGGCHAADWVASAAALNDFKNIFNAHLSDLGAHYTTDPTPVGFAGSVQFPNYTPYSDITFANYLYAICYKYSYTIGTTDFEVRSTPTYFKAEQVIPVELQSLLVNHIPILSNLSGGVAAFNYDTANIRVEVYRTINNGTTYYYVGDMNNGNSAFSDSVRDSELKDRQTLYTTGNVLPNDQPPRAKFFHTLNNLGYYANFPGNENRIVQSQPSTLDGAYGGSFLDLPQEVKGICSTRGILVAWTNTATYRIEGSFDELGQGQMAWVPIGPTVGLNAGSSPVQTDDGIFFWSRDGIYFTNGYTVMKTNRQWRGTYTALIATGLQQNSVVGTFDQANKRVWWGCNVASGDNDTCYLLDLNFPVTENSIYTTASGGLNFAPTALVYFNGQMIRGGTHGYVFKHDPQYTSDPNLDQTGAQTSGATWSKAWIAYNLWTPSYEFGTSGVRKWVPSMNLKALNTGTNLSLQVQAVSDGGRVTGNLAPIRYRGGSHTIEEKRKIPAGSLRCSSMQLRFTNAFVVLYGSDAYSQATLDPVAKTFTINAGNWPLGLENQFVTLGNDNYTAQWQILSQTATVLTLNDPGASLPIAGVYKWEVKGYPKDEKLELVSYCVNFALLGPSQQSAYGETGANT